MNSHDDAVAIRTLLYALYESPGDQDEIEKLLSAMEVEIKREAKDDREGGNKGVPGQHVPSEPFQEDD